MGLWEADLRKGLKVIFRAGRNPLPSPLSHDFGKIIVIDFFDGGIPLIFIIAFFLNSIPRASVRRHCQSDVGTRAAAFKAVRQWEAVVRRTLPRWKFGSESSRSPSP